jgi:CelD/BcsL family acetyltransferase involved in cellulose biosynthesis
MTIALRHAPVAPTKTPATAEIARIQVFASLAAAEPHWRALERANVVMSPYQRFDFLALWQRHIGAANGVEPAIAIAFDAGGVPVMLFPFGRRSLGPLGLVSFLGGKHANFNLPIWRRDLAPTHAQIESALSQLSARADVLLLVNQPETWLGFANPLGMLSHQPAPSPSYSGTLTPDFDSLLRERTSGASRKKMRKKAETLANFGTVRFARADTAPESRRVLDAFFEQKSARMRAQGIANVFDDADVRRLLEAAVVAPAAGYPPPIEIYSLSVNDEIIATMAGMVGSGRFSAMFSSIASDRFTAESPGEQLLIHLVRDCCVRGLTTFDLGVGEARYKYMLCGDVEPLFDSFIALSPAGRVLAPVARWGSALKRTIKQNSALWSLANMVRQLRGRVTLAA